MQGNLQLRFKGVIYFIFLPPVAMVAELVDAPVSKTGEVTLVPVRSRPVVQRKVLIVT